MNFEDQHSIYNLESTNIFRHLGDPSTSCLLRALVLSEITVESELAELRHSIDVTDPSSEQKEALVISASSKGATL